MVHYKKCTGIPSYHALRIVLAEKMYDMHLISLY